MKPALQLSIGQQLTLTPQLQQAIRLLQLSSTELNQELQELLESNPLLDAEEITQTDNYEPDYEAFSNYKTYTSFTEPYERPHTQAPSLTEHLHWQVTLASLSSTDQLIAHAIIDAIDEKGFLTCSLVELQQCLPELTIDLEEIEAVLHYVQHLDPLGVGARDLRECLLIQLETKKELPYAIDAINLVKNHFELLSKRDYNQLLRHTKLPIEQLKKVLSLIRTLEPKPGSLIENKETEYIIPDILVKKHKNRWIVTLNDQALIKLTINKHYAGLIHQNNADSKFIRNQLQEAKWLLKSLQSRHETLLKVAKSIFSYQQDFLEQGLEAMKPLVLHQIAETVNMHESTISRVTTKKYAETPFGIFELKQFFSSHVSKYNGGECSSTAIHALLKKLIGSEDPSKPLNDRNLATALEAHGICVARRTIAKYRKELKIPSSNKRKSLI